ncbi:MAG: hypothetical protein Q4D88_00740 [Anaerococcus sp.]|nr:hypothetical protein [Anaerococcus sp.]
MKFFTTRAFTKNKMALVLFFLLVINFFSFTAYPIKNNFDKMMLQSHGLKIS